MRPGWIARSPRRHGGTERTPRTGAGRPKQKVLYLPTFLTSVTLPHSKVAGSEFSRVNGDVRLSLVAPSEPGLPYGMYPRLILEYLRSFGLFGLWQLWQSSGPGGRCRAGGHGERCHLAREGMPTAVDDGIRAPATLGAAPGRRAGLAPHSRRGLGLRSGDRPRQGLCLRARLARCCRLELPGRAFGIDPVDPPGYSAFDSRNRDACAETVEPPTVSGRLRGRLTGQFWLLAPDRSSPGRTAAAMDADRGGAIGDRNLLPPDIDLVAAVMGLGIAWQCGHVGVRTNWPDGRAPGPDPPRHPFGYELGRGHHNFSGAMGLHARTPNPVSEPVQILYDVGYWT